MEFYHEQNKNISHHSEHKYFFENELSCNKHCLLLVCDTPFT